MPATPNWIERFVLLRLGKAPAPAFDVLAGASTRALDAARELGLFEALSEGPRTVEQLAEATGTSTAGLEALVPVLASLGYVDRDGEQVETSTLTERWFLEASEESLTRWAHFWSEVVYAYWDEHLVGALEEGAPSMSLYAWCDEEPERWRVAQQAFLETGRLLADEIVDRVRVPEGASRLLDVGGGHGLYAAELLEAHEGLEATVLDRPGALETAQAVREQRGLGTRLTLEAADYTSDDLGSGWDVVLLFNVLHGHGPGEARRLVERVADATASGGRLYILDQFDARTPGPMTEATVRLIGLNYFLTLGGGLHEADEVERWLTDAGFTVEGRSRMKNAPGVELVAARKPSA